MARSMPYELAGEGPATVMALPRHDAAGVARVAVSRALGQTAQGSTESALLSDHAAGAARLGCIRQAARA
jgi:hypothetical protein